MKCHKLFLIGAFIMGMVIPTQAAVYGTLKQDMYFDVDGNQVVKESGAGVSIIDEDGLNYLICIDGAKNDLVSKHFVKLQGTITKATNKAAIIAKVSQNAQVLGTVNEGDMVMVLAKESGFYKVKVNDTVGYIYSANVDTSKLSSVEAEGSSKGEEIVHYAKKFLGGRYVYGGNNLATGVDCSGFTQQIMKHFNISIARSSREQYASSGYAISEANIAPGDLVFYGHGSVDHVAIYAGNGQIIHANNERTGIVMSNLHYGKPVIGIKRVIK
ncbi:MAG: C40 family peptidase [Cellulosilyticum sp.]|nr:C40 family peptidase [Cellulosilyticum sp.]MEE1071806.1 C40 family peptidase [Cellulosilyticum sp.]